MKSKFVISREGGGAKTDIRPNRDPNGGWLVLAFEYADDGKRTKISDDQAATDQEVIDLLRQDPDFWAKFVRLAGTVAAYE